MMGKRRAALARMQRVIQRAKSKQALIEQAVSPTLIASQPLEIAASPPLQLSPYDQARVDKWIRDRIIDWQSGLLPSLPKADQRWAVVDPRLKRRGHGALPSGLSQRVEGAAGRRRAPRSRSGRHRAGPSTERGVLLMGEDVGRRASRWGQSRD